MVAERSVTKRFITANIQEAMGELEVDMVKRFQVVQDELTKSPNDALGNNAAIVNASLNEAHKSQLKILENMFENSLKVPLADMNDILNAKLKKKRRDGQEN